MANGNSASVQATPMVATNIEDRSVWDGVYTEQQRDRGEVLFESSCVRCHGEDLMGNDGIRTLLGETFMHRWNRKRAGNLFSYMMQEMPPKETLTAPEYADILAFLLSKNNAPVGEQELPDNFAALQAIRMGRID